MRPFRPAFGRALSVSALLLLTLTIEGASAPTRRRLVARTGSPEVQWIRARAIALDSTEPAAPLVDLLPLEPLLAGVEVITLGEGTHYTHEFQTMHHRLAEFFARELGVRVFTFEASWPTFHAIDDYIRTGAGDPVALLEDRSWDFWDTDEMLQLVRWARAWNESHPESEWVSILGVDPAAPGWPRLSAHVLAYLQTVSPSAAAAATQAYACLGSVQPGAYAALSEETRADCRASLRSVAESLAVNRAAYEQISGARAFAAAARSAEMYVQAEGLASVAFGAAYETRRDEAMAANVLSVRNERSTGRPIVFRAHNGHASANGYRAGAHDRESVGAVLRRALGPGLYALGSTSSRGTYLAIDGAPSLAVVPLPTPAPGSWETLLEAVGLPAMIVPLRGGPEWTQAPRPFFSYITIGRRDDPAEYSPAVPLPPMFDAVLYVRETTPTRKLR